MTSKLLVQSKDNEINRDIKFCPSIPQCSGDIALSNNLNLINPPPPPPLKKVSLIALRWAMGEIPVPLLSPLSVSIPG